MAELYESEEHAETTKDDKHFSEILEKLSFPDDSIPEFGWDKDAPGAVGNYWTFQYDEGRAFTDKATGLIFRIAHGMFRSRANDGYIVGVYRQTPAGLKGIAGFEIEKKRTGLSGTIHVEDERH